ncbi:MAG TPA: serine hydrolase domain-containing protein [Gemmatimonadales bacterium]|nr:serine hydrolase domain-containing protein [Gemmatimonadales bacterium]
MKLWRSVLFLTLTAAPGAARAQDARLDSLDAFVKTQLARRHIPGLSLAVIQDGKIVLARGYGVTDETTRAPVTTETLFQAGSISKPVSALGALHLVEAGKLSLDADVNGFLKSWQVPANGFTATEKVTLRRLLSHSAGLTVHGFPGYDLQDPLPTLVQVLDGARPANTPAIRVDTTPGAIWRYSGGGFTVMQQMVIDVTGLPFPRFLQETVLGPIGMRSSSFEQPQPPARAALTATGYYGDRTPVRGRWHLYPEMAAAGLWTTASDLARFAIEIQETLAGKGHGVISRAMAEQYLTPQKAGSGLGIGVAGSGDAQSFSHGGRDEGFDALLVALAHRGQGAAIMINANDNSRFMGRLQEYIARAWGWPQAGPAPAPAATRGVRLEAARLNRYAGYYELMENQMISLAPDAAGTGLETLADGLPNESFLALDSLRFGSADRPMLIAFAPGAGGAVSGVRWRVGAATGERTIARVAPLPSTVAAAPDPDPALGARVSAALEALRQGGAALDNAADLPPGTRKDFSPGAGAALEGIGRLSYLGSENVAGRGIHRHGSEVASVRYYRTGNARLPYLLVHLTAEGRLADFDLVDR